MKTSRSGYVAIPGSAALPGGAPRALPRPDGVAVPFAVLDARFEPEELAVFLQLWRVAVADELDACRASRASLELSTGLSQLRLGKALAGLVERGAVTLLDRDRAGTLYRLALPASNVRVPHDGAVPAPDGAVPASNLRAAPASNVRAPPPSAVPTSDEARPRQFEAGTAAPVSVARIGDLAREFLESGGAARGFEVDDVVQHILGLVEEGADEAAIRASLGALG